MNILAPNLGSTYLKYQLVSMPDERVIARGRQQRVTDYPAAIRAIELGGVAAGAVAFKTVHGGPRYRGTFRVDDGVMAALEEFLPTARRLGMRFISRAFGLEFLGASLDLNRNRAGFGDRFISPDGSPVQVLALGANEEIVVARRAYRCLTES